MFYRRFISLLLAAVILPLTACGHGHQKSVAGLAPSRLTTIGINAYLWRAALETFSFMPLIQTDANGGVIITDWYINPASPNERMRVAVAIFGDDLRADGLRISASRQVLREGSWIDEPVDASTVQRLEDVVLTRARDLRRTAMSGD
ncbi:MAG: DUF3576 domain-containing protein [Zymomonas mobilis subsp. pomaceae]|uniref:DUF3576 domain-containing protein n=1 Tax=Zymomonas mobilis subsp. pomaceae (strain ATCC 29192 / DSM 22645 / JCM 10191 / CCUG 17912 / NBRC 13757 / NCIMB 11200 / NRRL B-4491 / Barker I) TaxID=579138 RepID=F8EWB0_ZYMMT|nr:DUF3576 domain-containing protein [Zymomonas mobilis]AEI38520.1 hypothetical protein Zymop_1631 [Zymomonas mobilis subsp. pomaceae ATCC 29192]MDX5948210.1 DUF3576 domain-containing protein [Zymomonas mobilis subsp. pomaceae]GEB88966.1 hypothetical protein ZMO02_06030 [Zymomonas mobilis subsp. pomaceae]